MVIHGTPKKRRLLYFPTKQRFCFKSVHMYVYIHTHRTIYIRTLHYIILQYSTLHYIHTDHHTCTVPVICKKNWMMKSQDFHLSTPFPKDVVVSDPNQMLVSGAHPKHFNQGLREIPRDTAGLRFFPEIASKHTWMTRCWEDSTKANYK